MLDFAKARTKMVDTQVRTVDVTDYDLLAALSEVPRERFVPPQLEPLAYIDEDLPVRAPEPGRAGRYVMEPGPFAKLVQLGEIEAGERVLDVGCATGYSAAVLARLAGSVVALEEDAGLAATARETLDALGIGNVEVAEGPLAAGWAAGAPYDCILIEGAVEVVPDAFCDQLREGGRLVAVVGTFGLAARATVFTRVAGALSARPVFNTYVRPLPGFEKPRSFVF